MSGQHAPPSRRTGENLKALRGRRMGKNPMTEQMQRTSENLIVVKTQRTGANLRDKVARSHMPASVGDRGPTRSIRLNQNGKRSSSGNVFRRLGQDADLRDTLNRRRDQKQSQQSTVHNRHLEVIPRGQGEILIEDLRCTIAAMKENDVELITTTTGSPFNLEI